MTTESPPPSTIWVGNWRLSPASMNVAVAAEADERR